MGLPWSPAPGFTCQLWWIFHFHLRCSKLVAQLPQTRDGGKMESVGRGGWAGEAAREREAIRPSPLSWSRINQRVIYLRAALRPGARITMSASDKSQIPARQQQIVIGIPFMSHHMPSYPLQEKEKRALQQVGMGGQNLLISLSPWKERAPLGIHKGDAAVCLFEYQKGAWHGASWLLKANSHRFYQAGVWWSIIKHPTLVILGGRWNWGLRGVGGGGRIHGGVGASFCGTNLDGLGRQRRREYYLHKINSSKARVHTPIKLVNWLSMVCPWIYNTTTLFILSLDREDSPICMGILNVINNHNATCIFNGTGNGKL